MKSITLFSLIAFSLTATYVNASDETFDTTHTPSVESIVGVLYYESDICENGCDVYYEGGVQKYYDPDTNTVYIPKGHSGMFTKDVL